ncbi:hypothetical protein Dda_8291 [Drechslerella dactyloides]|uniref:Uncharacterized protein n=1 Tax=Drechslerella dactyloides TaxID=74499 RepID=A0AAD6IS44_DREDA|nr:hypothetical protein Dda_8291 [Drechslerella dactyloides]
MSSAPNNAIKARELPESLAPHSQYSTSEEDYCSWYDARARHTASDKLRDVTTPIAPKKKFPISTQSTSRKESLKGKTVDRPVVERVSEKGNGHNAPDPVIDVGHDHESCSLTSQKSEPIHKLIHDGLVRENDTAKPPKDLSAETSTSIAACPQIDAEKSLHTPLSPSNANAMTPSFTTISDQPSTSQTLATPSCEEIRSEGNDNQANTLIENHLDADQNISEEDSYELQALILHLKLVDLYSSPNGLLYQDRYTRSAPSDPQSSHHGSASFDSQSAGGSASENSTDSTGRKHGRSNDTYNGSGKADDPELKRARSKPPLPKDEQGIASGPQDSQRAFCGPLGFTQAPLFEESSLTNAKAFIQKGKKKEKKYVFQVARKPALPKHTTSETSLPKKFLFDDMDEFRKGFESWMTFQFHDPPFSWDTSEFENPDRSVRLQSLDELVAELDFKYVMDPHLSRNAGCFLVLKEVD